MRRKMNEPMEIGFLPSLNNELDFYTNQIVMTEYVVPLDEGITDVSYYRKIIMMLESATENDLVRIKIDNGGGSLTTALHLSTAIKQCAAQTIAEIVCECHSAASVIALACDDWEVAPWAHMLVHNAEYGLGVAKAPDIAQHVAFSQKQLARVLGEVYDGFLSKTEISKAIKGEQLYFDNVQIIDRLEKLKAKREVEIMKEMKNAQDNPVSTKDGA